MKVDINETTFFLAFMLEERKAKSTVLALNNTKTAVVTTSLTLFAFLICLILLPVPQTFMIAYTFYTLLFVMILCRKCIVTFMIPVLEEVTLTIPIPVTYLDLYLKCFTTFKISILEEIIGKHLSYGFHI